MDIYHLSSNQQQQTSKKKAHMQERETPCEKEDDRLKVIG